ncbi:MAG: 6-bladed beta-propeller [Marinifilaceae bacterium]
MYKTNKNIIALFVGAIVTILSISCSGNSSKQKVKESKKIEKAYKYASMKDGVLHLDLNEARKHPKKLKLSDICDSLIYIPLETKKECLLGENMHEIDIDGDNIFIHEGLKLFYFNINGKFQSQIGKTGRGAGEYVCNGYCLNKRDKKIYAEACYQHKFLVFDYNDDLLSSELSFKSHFEGMRYDYINNAIVGSAFYSLSKNKDAKYYKVKDLKVDNNKISVFKSNYFPKEYFVDQAKTRMTVVGSSIYSYKEEIFFQEIVNDTLFKKSDSIMSPHIILNNYKFRPKFTSDKELDIKEFMKDNDCFFKDFYFSVTDESDRYVFADNIYAKSGHFLFDKKEKELMFIEKPKEDNKQIVNNIDFVNDCYLGAVINNSYLEIIVDAADLISNYNDMLEAGKLDMNSKYTKALAKIVNNLTEESNPVIILARLKK